MKKVAVYSALLVLGLVGSQALPQLVPQQHAALTGWIHLLTMIGLAFIMIHVGYEFEIDKGRLRQYGWDYVVAATAATFPWLFCCLYFVFVLVPADSWGSWPVWKESLLASRFASPTSAGVLFSMLAAAGLATTWLFSKARILAIFDDLDTILLLIPLQIAMLGLRWQLGIVLVVMVGLLWAAWRYLHMVRLPVTWPWIMTYSVVLAGVSEGVYRLSKVVDPGFPLHLEILLPAFVVGCILAHPRETRADSGEPARIDLLDLPSERRAATVISGSFMCLVGLSFPFLSENPPPPADVAAGVEAGLAENSKSMSAGVIALHVLAITILANIGKMFASFCYKKEASWRERLALGISLWPRGEVGGGVLVLSLSYGISGPIVVIAAFSLALNLVLTGVFIVMVQRLIAPRVGRLAQQGKSTWFAGDRAPPGTKPGLAS